MHYRPGGADQRPCDVRGVPTAYGSVQRRDLLLDRWQVLDLNAQADLDVMTHLLHADVLVFNEHGFMKEAFDDLWRPEGKVLMSSDDFVRHLSRLK